MRLRMSEWEWESERGNLPGSFSFWLLGFYSFFGPGAHTRHSPKSVAAVAAAAAAAVIVVVTFVYCICACELLFCFLSKWLFHPARQAIERLNVLLRAICNISWRWSGLQMPKCRSAITGGVKGPHIGYKCNTNWQDTRSSDRCITQIAIECVALAGGEMLLQLHPHLLRPSEWKSLDASLSLQLEDELAFPGHLNSAYWECSIFISSTFILIPSALFYFSLSLSLSLVSCILS